MTGLSYPLSVANGSLSLTKDYPSLVKEAILSCIWTKQEERVMRPEYGREDSEFISVNNLVDILSSLRQSVQLGLEGYPDASFELLGGIDDNGLVEIQVIYQCSDGLERSIKVTI